MILFIFTLVMFWWKIKSTDSQEFRPEYVFRNRALYLVTFIYHWGQRITYGGLYYALAIETGLINFIVSYNALDTLGTLGEKKFYSLWNGIFICAALVGALVGALDLFLNGPERERGKLGIGIVGGGTLLFLFLDSTFLTFAWGNYEMVITLCCEVILLVIGQFSVIKKTIRLRKEQPEEYGENTHEHIGSNIREWFLKNRKIITTILGTVLLCALGVFAVCMKNPSFFVNQKIAQRVAEKYLNEKYDTKMQYKTISLDETEEPYLYNVYFSPEGENYTFLVAVDYHFQINDEYSADNYLINKLFHSLSDSIQSKADNIWKNSKVEVVGDYGRENFPTIPDTINDTSTLEELDEVLNFEVEIILPEEYPNANHSMEECGRIAQFLEQLQDEPHYFDDIKISYTQPDDGKEKKYDTISLNSWQILKSDIDVKEYLDNGKVITGPSADGIKSNSGSIYSTNLSKEPVVIEIEPTVLWSMNGLTVTAESYYNNMEEYQHDEIKFHFENTSNQALYFAVDGVYADGYVYGGYFDVEVPARSSVDKNFSLYRDEKLREYGKNAVGEFEFYFRMGLGKKATRFDESGPCTLRTSAYNTDDTILQDVGNELYNKNGLRIFGKVYQDRFGYNDILMYVENERDNNLYVYVDKLWVNGEEIQEQTSMFVPAGKKSVKLCGGNDYEKLKDIDIQGIELKLRIENHSNVDEVEIVAVTF